MDGEAIFSNNKIAHICFLFKHLPEAALTEAEMVDMEMITLYKIEGSLEQSLVPAAVEQPSVQVMMILLEEMDVKER
ncbi:hypothetical protein DW083_16015 [Parabacteroides sp. AF48-14]|nr:hypothetical protein DW083_16015 [Parabacteroides sp. AF48-14]